MIYKKPILIYKTLQPWLGFPVAMEHRMGLQTFKNSLNNINTLYQDKISWLKKVFPLALLYLIFTLTLCSYLYCFADEKMEILRGYLGYHCQ